MLGRQHRKGRKAMMEGHIEQHWRELTARSPEWSGAEDAFAAAVRLLTRCARAGGKILLCGNWSDPDSVYFSERLTITTF